MSLINNVTGGKPTPCARCQHFDTVLIVRAEHLCRCVGAAFCVTIVVGLFPDRDCFTKYVGTKVLKRLEANKIRGGFKEAQKTLLLPMSFGASSVTLLHILDQQLQNRAQHGRHGGYGLHVLFVDQSTVLEQTDVRATMELLSQRYPAHKYTTISLQDCFDYGVEFEGLSNSGKDRLQRIISSMPSASSTVDFISIARRRLIIAFAKKFGIDGILFGDSTTRIAEKTLSETAKGRGVALPSLTADGFTEGVHCIFPMRDLLRKEITAYASMVSPSLTPLISEVSPQVSASSKDATIDGLMSQYFESVEQNYPSIVANVVRTSGRLNPPAKMEACRTCSMCGDGISTDSCGGEQQDSVISSQPTNQNGQKTALALCYGCARSALKPRE